MPKGPSGIRGRKETLNMSAVILLIFAALFLALPPVDVAQALQPEQIMQEWASDRREDCLDDCRQWVEGYHRRGSGGKAYRFRARMYARCVAKCERQFWKEWDREMEDLKP
jgi:hypothetical protein